MDDADSLRAFFEHTGGEEAFQAYGDAVCAELAAAAVPAGEGGGLAVFGHAVFLERRSPKVAQAAGASDDAKAALLDMDPGETGGIRIDLKGGDVAKCRRVRSPDSSLVY